MGLKFVVDMLLNIIVVYVISFRVLILVSWKRCLGDVGGYGIDSGEVVCGVEVWIWLGIDWKDLICWFLVLGLYFEEFGSEYCLFLSLKRVYLFGLNIVIWVGVF